MSVNLFISYSHKDESFKKDLEEHLSPLMRNGVITTWNDRKIIAGQNWKDEIDDNLEKSDIILFLVSSSFIHSDYCHEIEVKTAIERHTSGLAILIPIFVRACDWQDLQFARFQGLPKDALAVNSWDDKDEAWLSVSQGIKKTAREVSQKKSLKKMK